MARFLDHGTFGKCTVANFVFDGGCQGPTGLVTNDCWTTIVLRGWGKGYAIGEVLHGSCAIAGVIFLIGGNDSGLY